MSWILEKLSGFGAALGNWNDRLGYGRGREVLVHAGRRWRTLDVIAAWLYTLPDRRRRA